jgi:hypothetical protein
MYVLLQVEVGHMDLVMVAQCLAQMFKMICSQLLID